MASSSQASEWASLPTRPLERDYLTVPNQRFAVIATVPGPTPARFAIKFRGAFATEEEAGAYVRRVKQAGDNQVDDIVLDMYAWVPMPPDPKDIENHEYQEEFLQTLMTGYKEAKLKARQLELDREATRPVAQADAEAAEPADAESSNADADAA